MAKKKVIIKGTSLISLDRKAAEQMKATNNVGSKEILGQPLSTACNATPPAKSKMAAGGPKMADGV